METKFSLQSLIFKIKTNQKEDLSLEQWYQVHRENFNKQDNYRQFLDDLKLDQKMSFDTFVLLEKDYIPDIYQHLEKDYPDLYQKQRLKYLKDKYSSNKNISNVNLFLLLHSFPFFITLNRQESIDYIISKDRYERRQTANREAIIDFIKTNYPQNGNIGLESKSVDQLTDLIKGQNPPNDWKEQINTEFERRLLSPKSKVLIDEIKNTMNYNLFVYQIICSSNELFIGGEGINLKIKTNLIHFDPELEEYDDYIDFDLWFMAHSKYFRCQSLTVYRYSSEWPTISFPYKQDNRPTDLTTMGIEDNAFLTQIILESQDVVDIDNTVVLEKKDLYYLKNKNRILRLIGIDTIELSWLSDGEINQKNLFFLLTKSGIKKLIIRRDTVEGWENTFNLLKQAGITVEFG